MDSSDWGLFVFKNILSFDFLSTNSERKNIICKKEFNNKFTVANIILKSIINEIFKKVDTKERKKNPQNIQKHLI